MTNQFDLSSGPGKRRAAQTTAAGAVDMFPGSHDLVGMDLSPDLLSESYVRDQSMQIPYGSHFSGGSNPVQEWYANNDGPWHPKGIALPGSQNGMNMAGHGFVFTGNYREHQSPSECDTLPIPSDSGYASQHGHKPSIATGSICYDESLEHHETQSLAGQFHLNMDLSNWNQQLATQPTSPSVQRHPQSTARELSCETCHKVLKTNSELKKHRQRHTKPHQCQVVGCSRTEGFSTSNDLERHIRSVHPQEQTGGNRYRCSLQACKHKEKIWPRADNFRAHIKRVHQQNIAEEDLERFVVRPIAPQDVLPDIAGMQPSVSDYNLHLGQSLPQQFPYWNPQNSTTASLDRQSGSTPVHQTSNAHVNSDQASDDKAGDIEIGGSDHTRVHARSEGLESMPPPSNMSAATPGYHQSEGPSDEQYITPADLSQCDPSTSVALPDVDESISEASEGVSYEHLPDTSGSDDEGAATPISPDEEKVSADSPDIAIPPTEDVSSLVMKLRDPKKIKEVLEALQTSGLLESLGYKKEQTPTDNEKEVEVTKPRQDSQNVCPHCKKGFPRRCELKKHMKRHEKPYGCTFEGCNKRFGSKNDWKRHENSQHFLLEIWKCDFQATQGIPQQCGKVSHRRETFRQHLVNSHQLDTPTIDRKLDECRVGRTCEANFWCGFCEKIINIGSQGTEAWTKRYDHIDDHIAGRNNLPQKQMDDWKSVDSEAQSDANITAMDGTNDKATPAAHVDRVSNLESTAMELPQVAVNKRKANRSSDNRPSKRSKQKGLFVGRCCHCGEVRSKMSPQCVAYDCQHNACDDCR